MKVKERYRMRGWKQHEESKDQQGGARKRRGKRKRIYKYMPYLVLTPSTMATLTAARWMLSSEKNYQRWALLTPTCSHQSTSWCSPKKSMAT